MILKYKKLPPYSSLHFTCVEEEDFFPMLDTGQSKLMSKLLLGAADMGIWPDVTPTPSFEIVRATLKRMRDVCGDIMYDTLIMLSSPQLIRYPMFEMWGNSGWWYDEEAEPAASPCFTEARLTPLGERIAKSLMDNLHPFPFPTLLVEGNTSETIHIPPHNLSEVVDACLAMIDKPSITVDELMNYIKGPDFPESVEVTNSFASLKKIYETGKGRITMKNEEGKRLFYNVSMCALGSDYRYKHFNLQEYLSAFIRQSRKNMKDYANAMSEKDSRYAKLANSRVEIDKLLREQLKEMKEMFADERRTVIK